MFTFYKKWNIPLLFAKKKRVCNGTDIVAIKIDIFDLIAMMVIRLEKAFPDSPNFVDDMIQQELNCIVDTVSFNMMAAHYCDDAVWELPEEEQ